MSGYKHIETNVAAYIAGRYRSVIEIGAGDNLHAANLLFRAGVLRCCTDISTPAQSIVPYFYDDVFYPDLEIYSGIDCIYSIRPVEEMIQPLIKLAGKIGSALYVYHLGFEGTDRPAPVKDSVISLHKYV